MSIWKRIVEELGSMPKQEPQKKPEKKKHCDSPGCDWPKSDYNCYKKEKGGQKNEKAPGNAPQKLKPELEKVVQRYAIQLAPKDDPTWSTHEAADLLRRFAHDLEEAEGEDPTELDPGGPPAGTTGRGK